ncbi:MAG: hypothetical protein N2Z68_02905 [Patescibacteria group bacterium]|nr:hypothetical protein [Patescibacteria group bacterium]
MDYTNYEKRKHSKILNLLFVALLIVLFGLSSSNLFFLNENAYAASVTKHKDTLSRLKVSTAANHEWQFVTPSGVNQTTDTIVYEFDVSGTAFDLSTITLGDIDLLEDTDGTPGDCSGTLTQEVLVSTDTAATNEWLVTINTTNDTITVGPAASNDTGATIAANACVILRVGTNASGGSNRIVNPASPGTYQMGISGTFGDTGETAVQIISDDQVAATATVDETLSFSISDNSIGFGTLSTSATKWATGDTLGSSSETSAHTLSASTNAQNGYVITIDGTTLTSGSNTISAIGATATAPTPGTEQFGLKASAAEGSGTVSAPYNTANYALDTAAFPDQLASASTASDTTTYTLTYIANISPTTEAGNYTATLTYTAAAQF